MNLCYYGCGKESKYFFKNGNGCCEKSPNSCKGKRKKDSEKKKGLPFKGVQAWKIEGYVSIPWNKGKKGHLSEESIKKLSQSLIGKSKGIASTPEKEELRKKNIRIGMKKNPLSGGLRRGSGRGKKGWYKGYWCDSSWELAWVIYNLEHNINFERNHEGFEYIYKGKKRKYYPDFIINEIYYEIKGRRCYEEMDNENKEKIKQFKKELKVLYTKDMKPYLTYTKTQYGINFTNLYE